jgi:3-methyladenine DNA glycosylase/8-oxoguanine DNA glycosylase
VDFSLPAALRFLSGFAPAGATAAAEAVEYVGAHVIGGEARLVRLNAALEISPPAAVPLVRRMFCLDWDGAAFAALEDPVVRDLRERNPGLRPVLFATPWEALVWALLGHRISMAQGARLKDALRDALGPEVDGRRAFPPPEALLEHGVPVALPEVKRARLLALAERGAAGELEADALLAMGDDAARAWLERSPGIGPWMSAFTLIRGVGYPDLVPAGERRLEAAVAARYGPEASLAEVSRAWSPFRSWVTFLLRVDAERGGDAR